MFHYLDFSLDVVLLESAVIFTEFLKNDIELLLHVSVFLLFGK